MDVRHRRMYHTLVCGGRECPAGLDVGQLMTDHEQRSMYALIFMLGVMVVLLVLSVSLLLFATKARAHDHDPVITEWMKTLMQPDSPHVPCCGLSDAYWADVVHVRDGKTYATITDDRDDAPLRRHHVPMGKEIEVPHSKLKWDSGNPTGHVVIFLNVNDDVLCYVQGSGI